MRSWARTLYPFFIGGGICVCMSHFPSIQNSKVGANYRKGEEFQKSGCSIECSLKRGRG